MMSCASEHKTVDGAVNLLRNRDESRFTLNYSKNVFRRSRSRWMHTPSSPQSLTRSTTLWYKTICTKLDDGMCIWNVVSWALFTATEEVLNVSNGRAWKLPEKLFHRLTAKHAIPLVNRFISFSDLRLCNTKEELIEISFSCLQIGNSSSSVPHATIYSCQFTLATHTQRQTDNSFSIEKEPPVNSFAHKINVQW